MIGRSSVIIDHRCYGLEKTKQQKTRGIAVFTRDNFTHFSYFTDVNVTRINIFDILFHTFVFIAFGAKMRCGDKDNQKKLLAIVPIFIFF